MISRTTNATLSRKTSACSDRMISSTAPRAAVILWPSAIVVLLRQFLAGTDDHEARGGRTTLSPARLLHHFYRLDPSLLVPGDWKVRSPLLPRGLRSAAGGKECNRCRYGRG